MLEIVWNGHTLRVVQGFPDSVKKDIGYLLYRLQRQEVLSMPYSRAMPSVVKGCFELRAKGEDGVYRVFYYLKVRHKIFVFHAFKKKTQKTPFKDILVARKNLKELL